VDWEAYLTSKGHRGRRATGAEIAYPCFFDCNEPADSRKRKLYVNSETGFYQCKVCAASGGSTLLLRHFGDEPDSADAPEIGRRSEVLQDATAIGEQILANNEDATLYLLGPRRGLPPEVIVERRLGYASAQWPLSKNLPEQRGYTTKDLLSAGLLAETQDEPKRTYEYFRDVVLIPYIENGRVVQLRGKDPFGRYYTAVGDAVRIYNADSLKGAEEALVVEGEFDTAMVEWLFRHSGIERLQRMAVIGLAGTGALPDDLNARLAHLKRVWIGSDPDEPGRKAAEKWAEAIGEKGVIAEWPQYLLDRAEAEGVPLKDLDWTYWIHRWGATANQVLEMLRLPTTLVSAHGALELYRNRPTVGLQTGYPSLDAAIHPGFLPGQVMVFLAKTGVGKTIILCNLAWNLRKRRVLFITLEMTSDEIWVRLARIARFYDPFYSDDTIAASYPYLRICDSNRLTEPEFDRLVAEYTEEIGEPPEIVLLDYLQYYARGRRGSSQYDKTSDAIMQLKADAKGKHLSIVTPSQVSRIAKDGKPIDVDDARDSGVIEETADFLFGLWRADDAIAPEQNVLPTGKLHLKILKSRHGGRDRVFLLQMGLHSLVLVDAAGPHAEHAKRESYDVFRGNTYEQWLESLRNVQTELRYRHD
jgi:5S rRNA maturation endonuclease (ribonuclease M5)